MKNEIIQVNYIGGYKEWAIVFYEGGFNRTYRFGCIPNTVERFIKTAKATKNEYGITYTK